MKEWINHFPARGLVNELQILPQPLPQHALQGMVSGQSCPQALQWPWKSSPAPPHTLRQQQAGQMPQNSLLTASLHHLHVADLFKSKALLISYLTCTSPKLLLTTAA